MSSFELLKSFLGKFQLITAQTCLQYLFCQIDVEISKATLMPYTKQCVKPSWYVVIFKFANFIPTKKTLHFVQNAKHHPSHKGSFNVKFQKFDHFSCRFSTSSTKLGEIKLCKLDDKASPDPWLNCFCLLEYWNFNRGPSKVDA